jgi:hypothetical protein
MPLLKKIEDWIFCTIPIEDEVCNMCRNVRGTSTKKCN